MDQIQIGKFIAECRHKERLTQKQLAERLGVSDRAVSKWERGICLMDISLLKPLSEALRVNVVDLLSGTIVPEDEKEKRYEESIAEIAKLNETKSKAFGTYGFLFAYLVFIAIKAVKGACFYDIVSILLFFISFKFYYKFKLTQDKSHLIAAGIALAVAALLLVCYIGIA